MFGMANKLFFVSMLLALVKCDSQGEDYKSKELLIGSWASCLNYGLYVELHFSKENDYAYHLDSDILDYNVGKYIVCSGKIHVSIQENDLNCEQESVDRMDIVFKSDNEFESVENGERYTFKRLSNKPIMNYKLGTKALEKEGYLVKFKTRKDTFDCSNKILDT